MPARARRWTGSPARPARRRFPTTTARCRILRGCARRPASRCCGTTMRRAIVQVGDIAGIVVLIEISLPALKQRVGAGQSIQPAWRQFMERLSDPDRYGLPTPPRVRHVRSVGPLATLVLAYRG